MQDEISWNENTCYNIYNPYGDTSPLEPCDAPKMRKYRPKDDRHTKGSEVFNQILQET